HLANLLAAVASDPAQRIASLPLLTPDEERAVLSAWNDTAVEFDDAELCLPQRFERQAARTPSAVAVVPALGAGEGLTYAALNRQANQLAHYLRGLGIGPGALVGLGVDRSPRLLVGLLGILKAG